MLSFCLKLIDTMPQIIADVLKTAVVTLGGNAVIKKIKKSAFGVVLHHEFFLYLDFFFQIQIKLCCLIPENKTLKMNHVTCVYHFWSVKKYSLKFLT